jgi:hypothetical protein
MTLNPFRFLKRKTDPVPLPEWIDGQELPPQFKKFLYRGKVCVWVACEGCGKPIAYSDHQFDLALTYRLNRGDTGDPRIDLLMKLGKSPEDLAEFPDAYIGTLLGDFVEEVMAAPDKQNFLKEHGVTQDEIKSAVFKSVEIINPKIAEVFAKMWRL